MMNFGFSDEKTSGGKVHLSTGGATATRAHTRSSTAPTDQATNEPNEKPAAQISSAGYSPATKSRAARKSSSSPRPSSQVPALRPTPRKLNRSTTQPMRAKAL